MTDKVPFFGLIFKNWYSICQNKIEIVERVHYIWDIQRLLDPGKQELEKLEDLEAVDSTGQFDEKMDSVHCSGEVFHV